MKVVVVLGSHGGTQMCPSRSTTAWCLAERGQADHGGGVRVNGHQADDQGHSV